MQTRGLELSFLSLHLNELDKFEMHSLGDARRLIVLRDIVPGLLCFYGSELELQLKAVNELSG